MARLRLNNRTIIFAILLLSAALIALASVQAAKTATDVLLKDDAMLRGKAFASIIDNHWQNLHTSRQNPHDNKVANVKTLMVSVFLTELMKGKKIQGYELFDRNGKMRFRTIGQPFAHPSVEKTIKAAVATRKTTVQAISLQKDRVTQHLSGVFIPLRANGKILSVHAVWIDQSEKWQSIHKMLLLFMAGIGFLGIGLICIPVTMCLFANKTLKTKQRENSEMLAQFKAAIDNIPQAITLFDEQAKLVLANRQYLKFYDITAELAKHGVSVEDLRRHRLSCGGPLFEFKTESPGSEVTRWQTSREETLEIRRYPIAGGGWVAVHTDISDEIAAKAEIEGARKFLISVIEQLPGSVIVKNPNDLRYILVNKLTEETIGLPAAEIVGKNADEIFSPEQAAEINRRDRNALDDPQSSVHRSERVVSTPGNGNRTIATRRIVIRDTNSVAAYLIMMMEDVTEERNAQAKIEYLAHHDAMTGLVNRAHFYEKLATLAAEGADSQSTALILLDLDFFKEINDSFGHAAGDHVLRVTSSRLTSLFQSTDIVARLGGDEFAVLSKIPADDPQHLKSITQQLVQEIRQPIEFEGTQIRVGATAGVALCTPDACDASTLMRHADIALYEAKEDGKGHACLFDLEMLAKRMRKKDVQSELGKAISRNELELHFQPIVDAESSTVRSMEALIRWRQSERGMIMPNEFVPIAEETGLILPIGTFILENACREAMSWPSDVSVSVNLSPVQFHNQSLVTIVRDVLDKTGLPAHRLELEITEAAMLQDSEENIGILTELRSTGVKIVMDDFGTGYSSLNYLRQFPFDKVKIDRSYVQDLVRSDGNSRAIINAVQSLCGKLGIKTTAEGVETKEQAQILRRAGYNEMQGYLFSKPVPASEVSTLIGSNGLLKSSAA